MKKLDAVRQGRYSGPWSVCSASRYECAGRCGEPGGGSKRAALPAHTHNGFSSPAHSSPRDNVDVSPLKQYRRSLEYEFPT